MGFSEIKFRAGSPGLSDLIMAAKTTYKQMKLFKLIFMVGALLLSVCESRSQQIPQFSQYMFNPSFINPAYTGYKQDFFLQSYYRKQWTGVTGSPETFAVSGDTFLQGTGLGVGGQLITDKLGAQRTSAVYGNLSYHLRLSDTRFLSFGLGAGIVNSSLDGGVLVPGDPSDPAIPAGREQVFYPDLKAGLFLYDEFFFIGAAAEQLVSPLLDMDNGDVYIQPVPHAYVSGGVLLDLSYTISLLPSFMYMDDFKSPARLDLNTAFIINDTFWIGGGYRMGLDVPGREIQEGLKKSSAIIGMLQVFIGDTLRFGYAYDHAVSGFSVGNFTTHDISISYLFQPRRVRIISPRYF